ncbi:MAG: death-on-curing family protein [Flavipsychrobacter sp.]|nr:death-on-curing family protein [Flavipsychrobacter sp.]
MISEADILLLHEFSIIDFGGSEGLRDSNLLLSAVGRPFQTFDGKELYLTPFEKAAALGESIIINHPFVDGNKRTAMLAMFALLKEYKIEIVIKDTELYDFMIAMSKNEKRYSDIVDWLKDHCEF